MKRLLKIFRNLVFTLIGLIILALVAINFGVVQTFLAQKATAFLSKKLNTRVSVGNLRIDLLNHVVLENVYVEDRQHDTLGYIGKAEVRITDWFLLRNRMPVLHYAGITNAYFHLYRKANSDLWNYAFIEDAFSSGTKKKTSTPQTFELDLEKIRLDNVRFHMDDAWAGYDYDIDVGGFGLNVDNLDLKNRKAHISSVRLSEVSVLLRDFVGGKPASPKANKPQAIDTTAFNPDMWDIRASAIDFEDCRFRFISKTGAAYAGEFDPEHMDITNLNTEIRDLRIEGDTLRARLDHFSANERSGLRVKEMRAKVSVSPVASICRDLYLETNNSTLGDYYAMHYDRFPDFTDYIEKVRMKVHLKESKVDPKDVAFFAPQLRTFPVGIVHISGNADGTVAALNMTKLQATDGFSRVKGDLGIVGLPDIDRTIFDFSEGEIFTSGTSILKYAPQLRDNPAIELRALDFVYFKGNFKGSIYDFSTQSVINTNLGTVKASVALKFANGKNPVYSGTVSSPGFNAGLLFRQSSLGNTAFQANLKGAGFNLNGFKINVGTTFDQFTFNGYTYKNIVADGILEQQRFSGKLLMNDSNIALGFYGSIDFSKQDLTINAQANLLSSNLQALHFSEKPSSLTADFDLNCSGKTIDDFIGSAKLYNINLLRNGKRLDLDSVNILSYVQNNEKHLDIESNLLSAKVNGTFNLSAVPASMQYFLSRYLPNYISAGTSIPAEQLVNFDINTRDVSGLIAAFSDEIAGFDSSVVRGNLNTNAQKLTLEVAVPFGRVGLTKMYNATLKGAGDLNSLAVNATIENLVVGKNVLNTSLKLDAAVGNDKLTYTLATKSDDQIGTATLTGTAQARHDSLYLSFLPSELFINNAKWEIASGNEIVYAPNYLFLKNLKLSSGLQQVVFNSRDDESAAMVVQMDNVDIGQLAALTPVASSRPDGRLNGSVEVKKMFAAPEIAADVSVSGAKIAGDTFGTVRLKGLYETAQKQFRIREGSGIFHDRFSLPVSGLISTDPDNKNQIDAVVTINSFPLKLLSPFLTGYVSNLSGLAEGVVSVRGTAGNPQLTGKLDLRNTVTKIDYTGALYTIPKGSLSFNGATITLDDIELLDVYKNSAIASGTIRFADLTQPNLNLRLRSDNFEIIKLRSYENELFYGHVIAKTDFGITGTPADMRMTISATPTQKSSLYIPYNAAGDITRSGYITFKNYGKEAVNALPAKAKDRLSVRISAVLNTLMDVTLVLDPNTGDQINATGSGNLSISVPANDDYSMFGTYNIDYGKYTFTFRQVLTKDFIINPGSSITFGGSLENTRLNIEATYPTRTRLYDLLEQHEVAQISGNQKEIDDAKATQAVNVQLYMKGTLQQPDLSYDIVLPEKRSMGTIAYAKLQRINSTDKSAQTNQVSSLLFLGSFIPAQGITGTMAVTGAKNTLGETLAAQASPLLTNALNKLIGERNVQIMLQYKSYGQDVTDVGSGTTTTSAVNSRDEIKFGVGKNYFNDRLKIQIGSAYDWGRPTTATQTTSSFNLAGDFRAQYLLTPDGGISLTGFKASNYDLFYGYNISRQGVGIAFRKSFDNLKEFFTSKKKWQKMQEEQMQKRKTD